MNKSILQIQEPKTTGLPLDFCYNTPYEDHWRKNKFVTFWPIGPPTYWNCAWEKLKFWMAGTCVFSSIPKPHVINFLEWVKKKVFLETTFAHSPQIALLYESAVSHGFAICIRMGEISASFRK